MCDNVSVHIRASVGGWGSLCVYEYMCLATRDICFFHVRVKIHKCTSLNEHEGIKLFINMHM